MSYYVDNVSLAFDQISQEIKKALNAVYGFDFVLKTDVLIIPKIKKVIFNPPATIVIWSDDTKTVVKCEKYDKFDPETGLAMAIARKYFGSRHRMVNLVDESLGIKKKRDTSK